LTLKAPNDTLSNPFGGAFNDGVKIPAGILNQYRRSVRKYNFYFAEFILTAARAIVITQANRHSLDAVFCSRQFELQAPLNVTHERLRGRKPLTLNIHSHDCPLLNRDTNSGGDFGVVVVSRKFDLSIIIIRNN
jgi:hypothetical protein